MQGTASGTLGPVRRLVPLTAVAAAGLLLSACFTGERPSFDPTVTIDTQGTAAGASGPGTIAEGLPSTPAELAALFGARASGAETAAFEIRPTSSTAKPVLATVSRDLTRLVVSIREIQYRTDERGPQTCRTTTQSCTRGLNSQPLSDLQISAQFWGPAIRQQLESPALAARIGPIRTTQATIAEQLAVCIDVPGPQVTDRYCALPTGMLAALSTAAVTVTLVDYLPEFDESLWEAFVGE